VSCAIDHLVIGARTLAQGAAWCEATLGVPPAPGGRHGLMATHNLLLAIGSAEFPRAYLEIIAVDPDAPPPGRTRWFGLDDPALQARLARSPCLLHAVARTDNIEMQRWGLVNLGLNPGRALAASRDTPDGRLAWTILLRDDGAFDCGGALPTLIQWQGSHPAESLPPSPVALATVALGGLPDRVAGLLRLRGVVVSAAGPALAVTLATPRGPVALLTG
jgi:hypothetical protein